MDIQKKRFVKETSAQILAAYVIEDRIAWHRDECFGNSDNVLIERSVDIAEGLYENLKEKGYFEPDQD